MRSKVHLGMPPSPVRTQALNRRKLLCLAAALILTVTTVLYSIRSDQADPRFNLIEGKPAIVWIEELTHGDNPDPVMALARSQDVAVPALLKTLKMNETVGARSYRTIWPKLPEIIRSRLTSPRPPAAEFRKTAARAFVLFGNSLYAPPVAITWEHADQVVAGLRAALADRESMVRMQAAAALGYQLSRPKESIDACIQALHDSHWAVRRNALLSLGHLATVDQSAIPILRGALPDPHPDVAKRAAEELAKLGVADTP